MSSSDWTAAWFTPHFRPKHSSWVGCRTLSTVLFTCKIVMQFRMMMSHTWLVPTSQTANTSCCLLVPKAGVLGNQWWGNSVHLYFFCLLCLFLLTSGLFSPQYTLVQSGAAVLDSGESVLCLTFCWESITTPQSYIFANWLFCLLHAESLALFYT